MDTPTYAYYLKSVYVKSRKYRMNDCRIDALHATIVSSVCLSPNLFIPVLKLQRQENLTFSKNNHKHLFTKYNLL